MPEQVAKAGQSAGQKFAQADAEYAGRLESLSMGERALLGLPYIANDADMTKRRMVARQLTYDFNHTRPGPSTPDDPISDLTNSERRTILATLFGLSDDSAKRIFIDPPFHWCVILPLPLFPRSVQKTETKNNSDFGTNIKFEGDFYANFNCTILDCAQVRIGHGVLFAPNVHIYAATHSVSVTEREQGFERALPVSIGSDTWVGGNVSIM